MTQPFSLDDSMLSAIGGAFYPSGYTMLMFPDARTATDAGDALAAAPEGGFEVLSLPPQAILSQITPTASDADEPLPSVGTDAANVRAFTKLAREGHHGLLVRTPDADDAERMMLVVREYPYSIARRYRKLVIEDL
ncbi:hypothetical protein QTH91_14670 [Variovorax dokdonensis]|uniref:RNA-binding protein n=1 Tax=Variovorax dokdonensis TaxID=344883 RepID=A0ABT7NCR3_9BURK|nr:hypothetical protein [Variovorax dokdonensis]MDM0045731.1 hypothetical protein [Variovorax dokdonensis]